MNAASKKRYKENKNYRESKLAAAAMKYKTDESFRSKRKASSKNQYSNKNIKKTKKDRIKRQRSYQRTRLNCQEEVVRVFREKAKQGIDYTCCCCDRLLFQNQVQRCEKQTYAKNDLAANVADVCIQDK